MKKVVIIVLTVIFVLFFVFLYIGARLTENYFDNGAEKLLTYAKKQPVEKFHYSEIDTLSPVLKKYFRFSLKDGIDKPEFVRLKQTGSFKTSINQDWKDLTAVQYFITSKPGFIWNGKITLASIFWLRGIDYFYENTANLIIKVLSGITITREASKEVAQAQLARWLVETPLFPTGLISNKYISWVKSDSTTAKAILNYKSYKIPATFYFNKNGSISKIKTVRYMTTVAGGVITPYTAYYKNYKTFNGITIPTNAEVEWNLDNQDFKYEKFNISHIDYNKMELFTEQ